MLGRAIDDLTQDVTRAKLAGYGALLLANGGATGVLVPHVATVEKAREYVRWAAANNIDGIKFFNRGDETPEIDEAVEAADRLGDRAVVVPD